MLMRVPAGARAWRTGLQWVLLAVACAWLAACTSPPSAPAATVVPDAAVEVQHTITGPTVFALLPPEARDPSVEGAAEAQAHVRFALADTQRCLGSMRVRLETVFADRLLVRDGKRSHSFVPDALGPGIGAVLIEPGRTGVMVQSMVGASALSYQLQQAAFEYWRSPACRRD